MGAICSSAAGRGVAPLWLRCGAGVVHLNAVGQRGGGGRATCPCNKGVSLNTLPYRYALVARTHRLGGLNGASRASRRFAWLRVAKREWITDRIARSAVCPVAARRWTEQDADRPAGQRTRGHYQLQKKRIDARLLSSACVCVRGATRRAAALIWRFALWTPFAREACAGSRKYSTGVRALFGATLR